MNQASSDLQGMYATPEHVVENMPYDWRIHAHMTGLKMGIHNFDDTRDLAACAAYGEIRAHPGQPPRRKTLERRLQKLESEAAQLPEQFEQLRTQD